MTFISKINPGIISTMSLRDGDNEIMRITKEGDIEWYGKPSTAAKVLIDVLGNAIDSKAASAGMRQRTYTRACRSILNKAKSMSRDDLIAFLEESVQNRHNHSVLLSLQDDDNK